MVYFDLSLRVHWLCVGLRFLHGKAVTLHVHIPAARSADSFIFVLVPLLSFSEVPYEQQHATLELLR